MNIKEKIGKRIATARKQAGLTVKDLAERTNSLKPARISNWEHGLRTPGPQETKQLAGALGVSAAYLMCLTDEEQLNNAIVSVPVLSSEGAIHPKKNIEKAISDKAELIHLSKRVADVVSSLTFAITIDDDSMAPEFKLGDIIVVDPDKRPAPGQHVIAYLEQDKKVLLRKYRELEVTKGIVQSYELIPINPDWATIVVNSKNKANLIGTLVEHRRYG